MFSNEIFLTNINIRFTFVTVVLKFWNGKIFLFFPNFLTISKDIYNPLFYFELNTFSTFWKNIAFYTFSYVFICGFHKLTKILHQLPEMITYNTLHYNDRL
jgi:hypothetical protein